MNDGEFCDTQSDNCWKSIVINGENYSVRAVESNGNWRIFLTNLCDVWIESLDHSEILQKCERLNPTLSIDDIDVGHLVGQLLRDIDKYAVEKSVECIKLAHELEGGIFKFSVNFKHESSRRLLEEVTMPLSLLAGELERRQNILLDLVRKKDEEITEYRLNGAELTRKYIKTEPFDTDLFKKNPPKLSPENCFKAFQTVMKLRGDIELENFSIKTEPAAVNFTKANDDREKLTKMINFESTARNENDDDSRAVVAKIEKKDFRKLKKKSITLGSEGDKEAISKRTGSGATASTVKRLKKTIHDFVT